LKSQTEQIKSIYANVSNVDSELKRADVIVRVVMCAFDTVDAPVPPPHGHGQDSSVLHPSHDWWCHFHHRVAGHSWWACSNVNSLRTANINTEAVSSCMCMGFVLCLIVIIITVMQPCPRFKRTRLLPTRPEESSENSRYIRMRPFERSWLRNTAVRDQSGQDGAFILQPQLLASTLARSTVPRR
jgi:hypothetical protein